MATSHNRSIHRQCACVCVYVLFADFYVLYCVSRKKSREETNKKQKVKEDQERELNRMNLTGPDQIDI